MIRKPLSAAAIVFAVMLWFASSPRAETGTFPVGGFTVAHEVTVPGSPEFVYDHITGDISGWWDHSFSGNPARFYIEAKPGGGFYEIFDESGDGVKHAEVIFAQRGKLLRFVGPLGFTGNGLQIVHTYTFEPAGEDSTTVKLDMRAYGEIQDGWPEAADRVWHHFLVERFLPYVSAKHAGR